MTNPRRKALFLDRDGVINVDTGYVHRQSDFVFCPGVFAACRDAQALGYVLVIATNQSGIGRGYFSAADFAHLTDWMLARLRDEGVTVERVYHDPTHPTAGQGAYRRPSPDRKPAPGMIVRARDELGLDLAASVLVGDSERDVAAGRAAGVGTVIRLSAPSTATEADHVTASLAEAVTWLAESVDATPRD